MLVAFFKTLPNHTTVITSGGKSYKFDLGGSCVCEESVLSPENIYGASRVCMIGVMNSGGRTEIALDYASSAEIRSTEYFRKYLVSEKHQYLDVVQHLQGVGCFICMLSRRGKAKGVRFTQAYFVYPSHNDGKDGERLESCISALDKTLLV